MKKENYELKDVFWVDDAACSNAMELIMDARSENEALARMAVSAFIMECNPTIEELEDVKTAISEAVTNSIVHGYPEGRKGKVFLRAYIKDNTLYTEVEDKGVGIPDISKAMQPLFTTRPQDERSGMGFAFMEAFTDRMSVESRPGEGTKVCMEKIFGKEITDV